ncbi:MAG: helix-turn-helix transcriptional regulator [Bradyrhizobium sp.]|nr:helix-turn-helix transcriptional regulator [Bradyrhizobium sp.]
MHGQLPNIRRARVIRMFGGGDELDERQRAAVKDFLRRAVQASGASPTRLAKSCGIAPSTINRPLNDPNWRGGMNPRTLKIISSKTGVDIPALYAIPVDEPLGQRVSLPKQGKVNLPVRGTAMGGEDGAFDLNGPTIDEVARPPKLEHIDDAYAVYMRGSSMEPKYEEGQLLYIHPTMPVRPGSYVVIQLADGRAFVKRLVRKDDEKIVVEQLNPKRNITYRPAEIRALHRIVQAEEI